MKYHSRIQYFSCFLLTIILLGCTSEKERIDNLVYSGKDDELVEYVKMQVREKEYSELPYALESALKANFKNTKSLFEKYVLGTDLDDNITESLINVFIQTHKGFGKLDEQLNNQIYLLARGREISLKDKKKFKLIRSFHISEIQAQLANNIRNAIKNEGNFGSESKVKEIKQAINLLVDTYSTGEYLDVKSLIPLIDELYSYKMELQSISREMPTMPEKRTPVYKGVYYLSGYYEGPFAGGGIVLKSGGKYYLIEDGEEPRNFFVKVLTGYVEDTGREITLDKGRNGTPCKVVELSDRETYNDDQARHRESLAEAQRDYAEEMANYRKALSEYATFKKQEPALLAQIESSYHKLKEFSIHQ